MADPAEWRNAPLYFLAIVLGAFIFAGGSPRMFIQGVTFVAAVLSPKAIAVLAIPIAFVAIWLTALATRRELDYLKSVWTWVMWWFVASLMLFGFVAFMALGAIAGHMPDEFELWSIVVFILWAGTYVGIIPILIVRYSIDKKRAAGSQNSEL